MAGHAPAITNQSADTLDVYGFIFESAGGEEPGMPQFASEQTAH
jgi:hypothetical protein